MCGIFGIAFLNNHKITDNRDIVKLVRALFKHVETRGKKASGITIISPRKVEVLKGALPGSTFIETPEFISFMNQHLRILKAYSEQERTTFILGHCRLDTKGSPQNNDNNHPIVVGSTVGVHNGIIMNDDDIYESFQYSSKFPKRIAEVDSEIIFALIDYYHTKQDYTLLKAIQKVHEELTGGFACAAVNTHNPYLLGLFRKSNPVSIEHLTNAGLVVFASELTMALDSIRDAEVGVSTAISLSLDEILLLDVQENAFSKHELNGDSHNVHY